MLMQIAHIAFLCILYIINLQIAIRRTVLLLEHTIKLYEKNLYIIYIIIEYNIIYYFYLFLFYFLKFKQSFVLRLLSNGGTCLISPNYLSIWNRASKVLYPFYWFSETQFIFITFYKYIVIFYFHHPFSSHVRSHALFPCSLQLLFDYLCKLNLVTQQCN